ncbi:MAG: hypothetical protein HC812_12860 [Leptolyngbya sp. RL_3_1]|nr:hypothetical protein [Leptolyngbya sp. RL_3_1]
MNAYKLEATIQPNGTLILQELPFDSGSTVEVIILEQPSSSNSQLPTDRDIADDAYLLGVTGTLTEWASEADDAAYNDL